MASKTMGMLVSSLFGRVFRGIRGSDELVGELGLDPWARNFPTTRSERRSSVRQNPTSRCCCGWFGKPDNPCEKRLNNFKELFFKHERVAANGTSLK
jgi:hypothetical protein